MITHVVVIYPMGHRQIVSIDAYMAAPDSFVASTHARLLSRRELLIERIKARRSR